MRQTRGRWTRPTSSTGSPRSRSRRPSWGYGNSGTRFHVFPWPGAARNGLGAARRRRARAPAHRLLPVGRAAHPVGPRRRLGRAAPHAPRRAASASARSTRTCSATTTYRLGSLCHPDAAVRAQALEHCRECVEIAQAVGSTTISLWLADGTNYPGQDDLRGRYDAPHRRASRSSTRCFRPGCGCSSSTSSSSRPSTAPTFPTGARRRSSAGGSARRRRCSSTPATTRRARTSSRSSPCCSPRGCSAASTSTTASTPTTT